MHEKYGRTESYYMYGSTTHLSINVEDTNLASPLHTGHRVDAGSVVIAVDFDEFESG